MPFLALSVFCEWAVHTYSSTHKKTEFISLSRSLSTCRNFKFNLEDVSLIGYDKVNQSNDYKSIVHFFLDDYKFESIYNNPEKKIEALRQFKAVLTPDFSMFVEMPIALQLFSTFKNRWTGAYLQQQGIKVIPTVRWGDLTSFNFCFDGIEKGSIVAVSTIGVKKQKSHFMLGYNEMLSRIKPSKIICYGKPFDEMKGDIIEVDYAKTNNLQKSNSDLYIKTFYGYVDNTYRKGGGSASGQSSGNPEPEQTWVPKNEDAKRFLGKPGEIKETFDKNGERRLTKIGRNGKAVKERHYSNHKKGHKHSNPHDHNIDWKNGYPNLSSPINYPKDNIPEFKSKEILKMYTKNEHILEYPKYTDINDFRESLIHGREIIIKWNDIEYVIEYENDSMNDFSVCVANKSETECHFETVGELLNYRLDSNDCVRDIITQAEVVWRNI